MTEVTRTNRWRGVVAVTLVAGGAGLLAKRPDLLLVATLGVVFAAYPWLTAPPRPGLELDRRVSEPHPRHGDRFEVTTTVRNAGEHPLFDLRVVDGVPGALAVVDGTPRHGTALRPGESTSFTYTVEAKRGRHRFEPATVVARDPSGAREVETRVSVDTEVDCTGDVSDAPLRQRTLDATGRIPSKQGGGGTEFFQTRPYERGDAMNRIDWNRYAGTGELTTVEYREHRAATVVLAVDARPPAYRGIDGEPHAVAYGVAAAGQLLDSLLADRNRVGIAAFGRGDAWLAPGTGRRHRLKGERLLAEHRAFASQPPDSDAVAPIDEQTLDLRSRLPTDAQVLILSPLLDDDVVTTARLLDAEGHSTSVVSPDVTVPGGPGGTIAVLEREDRVKRLRRVDVPVVDWSPDRPLSAAIEDSMAVVER